jgi:hypothetical protein
MMMVVHTVLFLLSLGVGEGTGVKLDGDTYSWSGGWLHLRLHCYFGVMAARGLVSRHGEADTVLSGEIF